MRSVMPVLKNTGLLSLGRDIVKGANTILDFVEGKDESKTSPALKTVAERVLKAGSDGVAGKGGNVSKQSGRGYKRRALKRKIGQSRKGKRSRKTTVGSSKRRKNKSGGIKKKKKKRSTTTNTSKRKSLKRKKKSNTISKKSKSVVDYFNSRIAN